MDAIESIETLLDNKLTNLKRLDTARLGEIEQLYADRELELSRQVEMEIERQDRERAIELMREREKREARSARESALSKNIAQVADCVEQMRYNSSSLSDKIKVKVESAKALGVEVGQLEALSHELTANMDRVNALDQRLKTYNDLQHMSDSEIDLTTTELSSSMVQCSSKNDELIAKFKALETRVQQQIDNLVKVSI